MNFAVGVRRTGGALCGAVPGVGWSCVVGVGAAVAGLGAWAGEASEAGCGRSGGGGCLGAMGGAALTGGAAEAVFQGMWACDCGEVCGVR